MKQTLDLSKPTTGADADLNQQMARAHVFVINSDPAFLDAIRVLLHHERYNVTSTNLVPQTHAMLRASGARLVVLDLASGEDALWDFVQRLVGDAATRSMPVVVTAMDPLLLDAAEAQDWPMGGHFHLLKPFDPDVLGDIVHALIGPA